MSNAGSPPPDWYPDPEQRGTQRWWDGTSWSDQRRPDPLANPPAPPGSIPPPPPGAIPPAPPGYVPYNPAGANAYMRKSNAGWALALSIIGLVICGPLSIVGLVMGRNETASIDRGETDATKRGVAQAAFIVGIIGVVAWVVLVAIRVS